MPVLNANGIDLAYDWHGPAEGPVMLLIMGLGIPSAAWPPEFIERLTAADYRVLTFDNRDVGRSEIMDQFKPPSLLMQALRHALRMRVKAPYSLRDMADDAAALMSGLGVDAAHVVGASMGGMIAQTLALAMPERVVSLTSIMSTTNDRDLPRPEREIVRYATRHGRDRTPEGMRRYHEGFWPLIESPAYRHSDDELKEFLDRIFARGISPAGSLRQTLAILATPPRGEALRQLTVPTLVIHGDADPLVPIESGYATAKAIPNADMLVFEGMGHDLPRPLLGQITDAIVAHAGRANVPTIAAAADAAQSVGAG